MRVDKFLKVSRLIKRRTVAHDACAGGRVLVGGRTAKPSHELKVGDILEIHFGRGTLRVEVLTLAEHAAKSDAGAMYREIREIDS